MLHWFWKNMKKNENGFTLVELLVVIVILGILATLAVLSIGDSSDKAKVAKVKADLKTIESAAELYKLDKGEYADEINKLVTENYLKKAPKSPVKDYDYTINQSSGIIYLQDTNGVWKVTVDGETFTASSDQL